MKTFFLCVLSLFSYCCLAADTLDKPRYLVIPKTISNPFFDDVEKGCLQAAAELGVECIYIGPTEADARYQDQIISRQIEQGIDGISVSVINSRVLTYRSMLAAKRNNIPVITFDSDFSATALAEDPQLRYSYIGTDNFQFGFQLGQLTQELKPQGGVFCILSGHENAANLADRVNGVYAGLGVNKIGKSSKWQEHRRCPIHSDDDIQRSLNQLQHMLRLHEYDENSLDAIITVGSWPQTLELQYTELVQQFMANLVAKRLILVFGDTLAVQKRLLAKGLAHGNIGQSPFDMGYQSIYTLHRIYQGLPVEPSVHTKLERCLYGHAPLCN